MVSQGCWPPPASQGEVASPGRGWRPMQWAKSKRRVLGSGGWVKDAFGDAEFHFMWKNEDTRDLSTSLLPLLRSLSQGTWPSFSESPQIDRPHCSTPSQPESNAWMLKDHLRNQGNSFPNNPVCVNWPLFNTEPKKFIQN